MRRLPAVLREELGGRGVLLVFVVVICMTTTEGTLLLLVAPYLDRAGYPISLIGAVFSLFYVTRLASRVPVGAAYRAARAKRLLALALLLLAASTAGFAVSGGALVPVVVIAGLHGFAFGSLGTLVLATVIDVTGGQRGALVMAWYTAALSAGYTLGAFVGGALGDAVGIPLALLAVSALPVAAILAVLALPEFHGPPAPAAPVPRAPGLGRLLQLVRSVDPRVWLAFTIVLYMNLVTEAVDAFFPLYGLAIGLPLAAVGVLKGLKSAAATAIRFGSIALARWVDHRTINVWGVLVMGAATFAVPYASGFLAFAVLFVILGFCRGILRVTSSASIAELRREGRDVGLSSGVYNAGLDIGAMVGPFAGGVLATAFGLPAMFQLMALASVAVYFGVALATRAGRADLRAGLPTRWRGVPTVDATSSADEP